VNITKSAFWAAASLTEATANSMDFVLSRKTGDFCTTAIFFMMFSPACSHADLLTGDT